MSHPASKPKPRPSAAAMVRRLLADRKELVRRLYIGEAIGERRRVRPPPPARRDGD